VREEVDHHPLLRAPHQTMLGFSLPVLPSLVAEPLTGLADTAFVARLGAGPLAALGVATTLWPPWSRSARCAGGRTCARRSGSPCR
jgi:Na+-driven multidrug efflux pump